MPVAPTEYVIISFPGTQITDAIAPAITRLVDSGTIRILDLVFIKKDTDGVVTFIEYDALPDTDAFTAIDGDTDGLLGDPDLAAAAELLDPKSSALFIMWEDLWAAELGHAIRAAGGTLVAGERIPHEEIVAALEEIGASA